MPDSPTVCPSCGARVPEGAERCEVCGAALAPDALPEAEEAPETPAAPAAPASVRVEPRACPVCGALNPPLARFCNQCATPLGEAAPAPAGPVAAQRPPRPAPAARPHIQPRAALIVTVSVVALLVLYLVTLLSQRAAPVGGRAAEGRPAAEESHAEPLPPELERRVQALNAEIESAPAPEARLGKQRELVNVLAEAGRFDRAAEVQREVAERENTAEAWSTLGNFYYDWTMTRRGHEVAEYAARAVEAYERSLQLDPDDLNVRTDLATAYLSSNNPMQGVQQVKMVLERDPNHIQANFNYGYMLAQIGRRDQAVAQFEKVMSLTEPGSPVYRQAEELLRSVRSTQSQPTS